MVDVLGPLSARPPTPPRTASRVVSEKDRMEDSPVIVQTPIESPFPAIESAGAPSSRQSKRVNFSPWTKYIKPPSFTNTKSKILLPSNECKPTKSILKPTNSPGPVSSPGITTYTPEAFAMLLESVTQQLAGESVSSRVDAYMQFFGALRAYEKLPPEDEIVCKLGLIVQFLQRDISRDLTKGGPLDTNLVIQALKLSVVLVWNPQISSHLPDDFKLFLIEHSLTCLEQGKLPKSVLNHYLSVLSTQKFHAKIMTNSRITRILTMLHGLSNRVKGNAVVSQRLLIYERLFEQSKSAFVSQSVLWMDHLLSGLLHHLRDVRIKAIELGFNAYMAFGPNPTLSKTLRDIFDRPLDKNRKLASEICERMSRMMANAESGDHVPQIWGVIVLLLRSKRFNIDQWQHFKEWVLVLQKCFNCSDSEIKSKAIGGWNRFVLVANISETTSRSLLRMLIKPILSQFERKKQEKHGFQPSQLVVSSYYNLLYYAFRPSASRQQLDIVWEEYMVLPSSNIFSLVPSLSDRVANAVSHMLWNSQAKAWSENRVNEPRKIVPEELPSLDCKWIRSRITSVLKVFEDLLKSSVWNSEMEKSNIAVAWLNLSSALSYAASNEITPSTESMQAVAHVLGLLQRLWNTGPSSLNVVGEHSMDLFFERFRFLSITMIRALGSIPFTEKLLLKTSDATYQAANTPTHRHPRADNSLDSPILHLLRLISDVSGISEPTAPYLRLINDTLHAACDGRVTRSSRLELLRQCANLYPSGNEFHFGVHNYAQIVWNSTAQLAVDCLCSFPIESARERDGSVSRDYENVVMILSAGLKFPDVSQAWNELVDTFIRVLKTERGDRAVATIVVEPLSESMMSLSLRNIYLPASSLLNHSSSIPFVEHDKAVMPEGKAGNDGDSDLPFPKRIVGLATQILRESYERFQSSELNGVAIFIESLTSFMCSGVAIFRSMLLDSLQVPIALYLKDASRKLTVESGVESRILTACRALSSAVLNILQGALPYDFSTLQRFEHIICAGLSSSHVSVVKRFMDFWSTTFETQKASCYPETVSQALQNLKTRINNQTSGTMSEKSPDGTQNNYSGQEISSTSRDITKSCNPFILDAPLKPTCPQGLHSSPVTKGSESTAAVLHQLTDSPQRAPADDALDQGAARDDYLPPLSNKEAVARHSEVFSMIDNLRSSSPPTHTPRELGFMTPPHLHSLRNTESGTKTPQTPTLPAVPGYHDDGFLGSSPTPGIRGRTQSVASEIPPSLSTPVDNSHLDVEPPSSPPEFESRSSNSRQKSRSPGTGTVKDKVSKNKKKKNRSRRSKALLNTKSGNESSQKQIENQEEYEESQSLRSRVCYSTEKMATNKEEFPAQKSQGNSGKTMCYEFHRRAPSPGSDSKSFSKTARLDIEPEKGAEGDELIAYSSSDETETQVTSQLKHDLVSAVDLEEITITEPPTDLSGVAPVTRKRKREEEGDSATVSRKERRRSSRLSSAPVSTPSAQEKNTIRSKKQKLSIVTQNIPSSPAGLATKKRQQDVADTRSKHSKQEQGASKDKENTQEPEPQDASQKRRSSRISGIAAPDIPEDSPLPKKSPRSSRARKQSKRQKEGRVEKSRSQVKETQVINSTAATDVTTHNSQDTQPEPLMEDKRHQYLQMDTKEPVQSPQPDPAGKQSAEEIEQKEPSLPPPPQISEETNDATDIQMADIGAEGEVGTSKGSQPTTDNQMSSRRTQTDKPPVLREDLSITTSLRKLLDDVKLASLDRDIVKEMDDLLFDIRLEMHEALRRQRDTHS